MGAMTDKASALLAEYVDSVDGGWGSEDRTDLIRRVRAYLAEPLAAPAGLTDALAAPAGLTDALAAAAGLADALAANVCRLSDEDYATEFAAGYNAARACCIDYLRNIREGKAGAEPLAVDCAYCEGTGIDECNTGVPGVRCRMCHGTGTGKLPAAEQPADAPSIADMLATDPIEAELAELREEVRTLQQDVAALKGGELREGLGLGAQWQRLIDEEGFIAMGLAAAYDANRRSDAPDSIDLIHGLRRQHRERVAKLPPAPAQGVTGG